jgi:hypothetical protein
MKLEAMNIVLIKNGEKYIGTNSNEHELLKQQIKESYGRILYTYTAHIKMAHILEKKSNYLKTIQIFLSALTGSSLFILMFTDQKVIAIIGTIISIILIIVSGLSKTFYFSERAFQHVLAHNSYWKIKEAYISLIVDFDRLELSVIITKRDNLVEQTAMINQTYPKTNSKAYKLAQQALQI